jgi:hypothetical protein
LICPSIWGERINAVDNPEQREQIRDGVFERPIEHQDLAADLFAPRARVVVAGYLK